MPNRRTDLTEYYRVMALASALRDCFGLSGRQVAKALTDVMNADCDRPAAGVGVWE